MHQDFRLWLRASTSTKQFNAFIWPTIMVSHCIVLTLLDSGFCSSANNLVDPKFFVIALFICFIWDNICCSVKLETGNRGFFVSKSVITHRFTLFIIWSRWWTWSFSIRWSSSCAPNCYTFVWRITFLIISKTGMRAISYGSFLSSTHNIIQPEFVFVALLIGCESDNCRIVV